LTREELQVLHQQGRENIPELDDWYGHKCANCGTTEDVHYHHIVPLSIGGTNAVTNMVPLCQQCHYLVHHGVRLDLTVLKKMVGGRPRCLPTDEMKKAWVDYIYCRIPRCELERVLGHTRRSQAKWMSDILESEKIDQFHNNIGCRLAKGGEIRPGQRTGWIRFKESSGRIYSVSCFADRIITAEEYGIRPTFSRKG